EGAPLVAGGRLWAALARFEDGRVVHAVVGFDPADPDPPPDRPNWTTDVCDAPAGGEARARPELLTLAGRNVVLCSNTGAVVAVDAATGRRAWAFLYPRASRRPDLPRPPDPSPAVADGGRVFVAPADADRVFALDAETGRLLWESDRAEGAVILGVTAGRVVVTVTGPLKGIRGLSVVTGSHRRPDGWSQVNTSGRMLSYGRGFVADGAIAWPSRDGLYLLDPETGDPVRTAPRVRGPRSGLWGNLAYADGVLVVVTPSEVWGFVADGKSPLPADPPPDPRGPVIAAVDRAERQLADGEADAARATLLDVAKGPSPVGWRAWAAARLHLLGPTELPRDVWPPDLLAEWLISPTGEFVTLRDLIGRPDPSPARPPDPIPAQRIDRGFDLSPDACVRHEVPLPPASVPLTPIPGATGPPRHLFIGTPDAVLAVALAVTDRSVTRYPAADHFTHAADLPRGFVAAGPFAVAVFTAPGEPPWVFRVPETDPLPDRPGRPAYRTGDLPVPPLSSFRLAGAWLLARLGDHHLLALDLPGRRVAWVLGGDGQPGYRPVTVGSVPRFCPELWASDRVAVVQLSDGRRWTVEVATGRRLGAGTPTARAAWPEPPVLLGGRLLVPDGPGRVRLTNPVTGRVRWSTDAGGEASLAGDPPAVRAWGEVVIAAVRRDTGVEIDRLDPADGSSLWAGRPAFVDAARVDLRAADADPHHLYLPAGDRLVALDLGTGKPAWAADLPPNAPGGWVVRAARRVVVVFPAEALPAEPVAGVWERAVRSWARFPAGWRLPGLAAAVYDTWAARTAPVLLLDPETGEHRKTIALPAAGPGVVAVPTADALVVATGDRVAWVR
ncbi:MAG: PQQ-binding-like beta-propeller repeat protein, partial [Gemmataceae bacterium]|nr:PQQ-binding-like beta-propeller repeat protein [Gemmataceae bacterium]